MSESKGLAALRRDNGKPEPVTVDGEKFLFRKLTLAMEAELDEIVRSSQNPDLKEPEVPAEGAAPEVVQKFAEEVIAYRRRATEDFRALTAKIMKFVLADEDGKKLFNDDDDICSELNNVYAEKFSRAYMQFRQGAGVTPAAAEARFPG